jgi:hypothetical protein
MDGHLPGFVLPTVALWLLALAYLLNNPEPAYPEGRAAARARPVDPEDDPRCPFCGAPYQRSAYVESCWCWDVGR